MLLVLMVYADKPQASSVPLADPYILFDGGIYYAYGTHSAEGIEVYCSSDLESWEPKGLALSKSNTTESRRFWAPEVYRIGEKYYMYYTADEHLFVAIASSPTGPFRQQGGPMMEPLIGNEKCIDSSVFFDDDGRVYCFFVRFTDGNCIWMCQLHNDLMTPIEGTLCKCFGVSQPWEQKLGRVNEGPFVLKRGGIYYLTYSGNDFRSPDYAVGYATTRSLAVADGETPSWQKYSGNPILLRIENLSGTGHHSFFYDAGSRLRIVFHAHHAADQVSPRSMYIGTADFDGRFLHLTSEPVIRPIVSNSK